MPPPPLVVVSLKILPWVDYYMGKNLQSTETLARSMNEPLIGRGPNIDTSMIVLLISKYAEPLALSIIECLRKMME